MAPSPGSNTRRGNATKREHDDSASTTSLPERKKARVPRKECSVCLSDVATNQYPKKPHAGEQHSSDVCFKCFDQHIKTQVDSTSSGIVSCPQCLQTLAEPEVRKLAKHVATYQKYIDGAAKRYMQEEEEYHACPNATCDWGAFFAKDDGNILNCQKCHARYCLSCNALFHEGQLCAEYLSGMEQRRAEDANEQTSQETIRQISKKCPSALCGVNIQKISGCDHITCQVCRHEFCWLCFASYAGIDGIHAMGNSAHLESCEYSPNNLPDVELPELTRAEMLEDQQQEGAEFWAQRRDLARARARADARAHARAHAPQARARAPRRGRPRRHEMAG